MNNADLLHQLSCLRNAITCIANRGLSESVISFEGGRKHPNIHMQPEAFAQLFAGQKVTCKVGLRRLEYTAQTCGCEVYASTGFDGTVNGECGFEFTMSEEPACTAKS